MHVASVIQELDKGSLAARTVVALRILFRVLTKEFDRGEGGDTVFSSESLVLDCISIDIGDNAL